MAHVGIFLQREQAGPGSPSRQPFRPHAHADAPAERRHEKLAQQGGQQHQAGEQAAASVHSRMPTRAAQSPPRAMQAQIASSTITAAALQVMKVSKGDFSGVYSPGASGGIVVGGENQVPAGTATIAP